MATGRKPGPPLPSQMADDEARRVSDFLERRDRVDNERLPHENLECPRAIDDELGRMLDRGWSSRRQRTSNQEESDFGTTGG
jgi:hypothetical protein